MTINETVALHGLYRGEVVTIFPRQARIAGRQPEWWAAWSVCKNRTVNQAVALKPLPSWSPSLSVVELVVTLLADATEVVVDGVVDGVVDDVALEL